LGETRFLLVKNEEEEESSSRGFCSKSDPFYCLCNNDSDDDSETTELALMGKSESKHSKEKIDLKMMPFEAANQDKRESIDNTDVPMLSKDNYQQRKGRMNYNLMNLDVWHLVCKGYTKFPTSNKEVQKNNKALSNIFCSISDSILNKVMHYTYKQVWDNL